MPKFNSPRPSFSAGELSPKVLGRIDLQQYQQGCERLENMILQQQGGVTRCPGSQYVAGSVTPNPIRLIPFVYSKTEAYAVAITNGAISVIDNANRTVTNVGLASSGSFTASYYTTAELPTIQFAQSADILYLVCPTRQPQMLVRTAANTFALWPYSADPTSGVTSGPKLLLRRPFRAVNNDPTWTMTAGAASGTTTLTSSKPFFNSGQIGTYLKMTVAGTTFYVYISAVADSTHATVIYGSIAGSTTATADWEEAAWSDYRGWPRTVCFYKGRLLFGGNASNPDTIWGSKVANFAVLMARKFVQDATTDVSGANYFGAIADSDATYFTLQSQEVNQIQWLSSGKTLAVGTLGAEYVGSDISASGGVFTAESAHGSSYVQSKRAGYTLVYVPRDGKRLLELVFDYYSQSYVSTDLALHADHMVAKNASGPSTFAQIEYQESRGIFWAVTTAGSLVAVTRNREQQMAGWHYHPLGGSFSLGNNSKPYVTSIAILPARDGLGHDDLWIAVTRTINGSTVNYIEVIGRDYDYSVLSPALMVNDLALHLGDSSIFVDRGSPGTTFATAAPHLVGQTVCVLADGKVQANRVVGALGAVTLDTAAQYLVVGLPKSPVLKPTRVEAGAALGTARGAKKKIDRICALFVNTSAAKVGRDATHLEAINFLPSNYLAGTEIPLFTGEKILPFMGDFDTDGYIYITSDLPLPMTVAALFARGDTNEA